MNPILIATIVVTAIGLLCAIMLAVASKVFAVKVNEKTEQIRGCLPGANCGACGYAGCDGYAQALAEGNEDRTTLCTPGAGKVAAEVADILGVAPSEVTRKVALVHCNGTCDKAVKKADYHGPQSCSAAKLVYGGENKCVYGCLGLGDCVSVCEYDAIHIVDGVARVDIDSCTACGLCVKKCPNALIEIIPAAKPVAVKCSNNEKGATARKNCEVACIACTKCAKVCPTEAITIENNLARIDYEKRIACVACAEACPTNAIKFRK
jgi:RnfABCDGE-type electron transport complex B subunit